MAPSQHEQCRNTIALTLGISPAAREISMLSTLLGGLSGISVRGSSLVIPLPSHLVRADIEPTLKQLPGITLNGDASTIIATRSVTSSPEKPLSLETISLPPIPPTGPVESPSTEVLAPKQARSDLTPKPVNERTRQRTSQLLETLGLSLAQTPNYSAVISVLDKAGTFHIRETKNTSSDGFIIISVETHNEATALLEGLGFTQLSSARGNLWAGQSYQRVCHDSDTKATANIALTSRACEITIEYGEPLIESRAIVREFTALGSSGAVD